MDKGKIAQRIKNELGKPGKPRNQKALAVKLGLNPGTISRLLNGVGSQEHFKNACVHLGLPLSEYEPLKIAFSSGFWAAPLLAKNQEPRLTMTKEFFKHVQLTAYSDLADDEPIFSVPGKHLNGFDRFKHSFYFSGEVADKVKSGQVDIGFLGSTLAKNSKFMRVAQVVDASSARHALLVLSPKGTFRSLPETPEAIREITDYLLTSPEKNKPACLFLYQPGSTSAREYELLFHDVGHDHEDIQILNIPDFEREFLKKVKANPDKVIVTIALMMTVDAAKKAVERAFDGFDMARFRTAEVIQHPKVKDRLKPSEREFFYDMIIQQKRKEDIVKHEGFPALLLYLGETVEKLTEARTQTNDPDIFKRVVDFYDLEKDEAIKRLKATEFRMVFYPEFVEFLLNIAHGNKLNF